MSYSLRESNASTLEDTPHYLNPDVVTHAAARAQQKVGKVSSHEKLSFAQAPQVEEQESTTHDENLLTQREVRKIQP